MKNVSSHLKMQVLGAIDLAPGRTERDRIRSVSERFFTDEEGNARRFTWRTIETWLVRYRKHGVTSIEPKDRSDKGQPRAITPQELLEAVESARSHVRGTRWTKALLYRVCIEQGYLTREQIAPNTFSRLVDQFELCKPDQEVTCKRRLAFAKPYANDMWQADTLVGPYVPNNHGVKQQSRLIAFIDDASRVLAHGQFFFNDNVENLFTSMKSAFYKRGLPHQLYVDNGSNYSAKEVTLLCARLGILLSHTPVRDGAAKGKIERFFRTVRESFFTLQLDLSSLAALNRQFNHWVENEYNNRTHSVLKMSPVDRFGLDLNRIRFLPPNPANDELFYLEDKRKVIADNTFSFRNIRFEAPCDLRNREVQIRFDRLADPARGIVVYYKNERMGLAYPLDATANDRAPQSNHH